MNASKIIGLLCACVAACGCVSTSLVTPDGWQAKRTAFGLNATVGEVEVENGPFKARMKGYQSDGVETIRAVAEGVASGLNPVP
jgi:hypothetical protein